MNTVAAEIQDKLPKVYSKNLVEALFRLPYTKRQQLEEEGLASLKTIGNYLIALEKKRLSKE